jgi:CRP-like cAMP-binding protein
MLDTVSQIPLLQDLGKEQVKLISPLFEKFTCPANGCIFEQNEPATYLYVLIRGTAVIHYKPYDGTSIILSRLRAGDAFGWSSVVGGLTYTSSIYGETEIEAFRIRGDALRKICREEPDLGSIILDRLAEAVSGRWKNSREQVQTILQRNMKKCRK